ncbi:hypothetical protein CMI45_00520 [Candidatus Pacearchaeota archaeon]|nr:hypothetical protein [Candidatus Pacearchaeota archaeon]
MDFGNGEGEIVEAIEDGKIVKVQESYALREGLLIIRKNKELFGTDEKEREREPDEKLDFDDFRRPLKKDERQVPKDLVDNFHWEIVRKRRYLNLSRRQFADSIGENEETVKALENGILPKDDFILINKVQETLGINLRKDRQDFGQDMRKLVEDRGETGFEEGEIEEFEEFEDEKGERRGKISGDEITLLEE